LLHTVRIQWLPYSEEDVPPDVEVKDLQKEVLCAQSN